MFKRVVSYIACTDQIWLPTLTRGASSSYVPRVVQILEAHMGRWASSKLCGSSCGKLCGPSHVVQRLHLILMQCYCLLYPLLPQAPARRRSLLPDSKRRSKKKVPPLPRHFSVSK